MLRSLVAERDKALLHVIESFKEDHDVAKLIRSLKALAKKEENNMDERTLLLEGDTDEIKESGWDISNEFERRQIIKDLDLENLSAIEACEGRERHREAEARFRKVLAESKNFLMNQTNDSMTGRAIMENKHLHSKNFMKLNENTKVPYKINTFRKLREDLIRDMKVANPLPHNSEQHYKGMEGSRLNATESSKNNMKAYKNNRLLAMSANTCLRYMKLKELLSNLAKPASNSRLTKEKFIAVALRQSKLKFSRAGAGIVKEELEELYVALRGKQVREVQVKELAGGLAILCTGSVGDKIKTALSFISPKQKFLNFKTIFTLLLPIYRLLLEQVPESIRRKKITAEDLSTMTALQFLDQRTPTCECFTSWFTSQAKTLVPRCSQSPRNGPEEIEVEVEPVHTSSSELSLSLSRTSVEERKLESAQDLSYANPLDTKRQWDSFLRDYYDVYGFYPPPPPLCGGTSRNESIGLKTKSYVSGNTSRQKCDITKSYRKPLVAKEYL